MGATVKGLQELLDKLKKNEDLTPVKMIVKKHGSQMHNKAVRLAPVGTEASTGIKGYKGGTLRRSIQKSVFSGGLTVIVDATAEYSMYVEYGTRYMQAQPFIRPAYYGQVSKFINDIQKLMK